MGCRLEVNATCPVLLLTWFLKTGCLTEFWVHPFGKTLWLSDCRDLSVSTSYAGFLWLQNWDTRSTLLTELSPTPAWCFWWKCVVGLQLLYVVSSPLAFTILTVFNLIFFYFVVKYTLHSIVTVVNEELALLPCLMSIDPSEFFYVWDEHVQSHLVSVFHRMLHFSSFITFDLCVFVCKASFSLNKINKN